MPETPPPISPTPTASQEDTDQDESTRQDIPPQIVNLKKRPLEQRQILAGCIAPEVLIVSREEYNTVLAELRRLNDSGDCGRMVEGIVAKLEKWNP